VRVSVGTGGAQSNGASVGEAAQVYLRNFATGRTVLLSKDGAGIEGRGSVDSFGLGMSGDGGEVVFGSAAPNLVPGHGNGADDVFVHDGRAGVTRLVGRSSAGAQGNGPSGFGVISADGR
jgi:hypothetical protein